MVVCIKVLSRTEQTVVIMFYWALFTTLISLFPALATWITPSLIECARLLLVAGALSLLGVGMFTHGIGLGELSFIMPFDFLRIVYASALGFLLFAEVPHIFSLGGSVVILVASLYLLRIERLKRLLH